MTRRIQGISVLLALGLLSGACSSAESPDPLGRPQSVAQQSAEREAQYLNAVEDFLGVSLASVGFTKAEYLVESYRWCAMLTAIGPGEAVRQVRAAVESQYPPDQVEAQIRFVLEGNRMIERYLCES